MKLCVYYGKLMSFGKDRVCTPFYILLHINIYNNHIKEEMHGRKDIEREKYLSLKRIFSNV